MDPNVTLAEIRHLVTDIASTEAPDEDDVQRLAELVGGLDEWLSRGGFPPADWDRTRMKVPA
jgi:hypothetical protein